MKRIFVVLIIGILLLAGCDAATGITISEAWARPAGQGGNGAVYFLLQNHATSSDELLGATSNVAEAAEIHESKMEGDVMQMQHVMSVPIKGKASLEFAPGGYHVMLIGLKQDLKAGDEFNVTLQFQSHADITLTVPVQETGPGESISDH